MKELSEDEFEDKYFLGIVKNLAVRERVREFFIQEFEKAAKDSSYDLHNMVLSIEEDSYEARVSIKRLVMRDCCHFQPREKEFNGEKSPGLCCKDENYGKWFHIFSNDSCNFCKDFKRRDGLGNG